MGMNEMYARELFMDEREECMFAWTACNPIDDFLKLFHYY